jgi:hypothetical protein
MEMETTPLKMEVKVDPEFLRMIGTKLEKIEESLIGLKAISPPEFYTPNEFIKKTGISRWQLNAFQGAGLIRIKKIGRKVYIPEAELARYFAGEITLK